MKLRVTHEVDSETAVDILAGYLQLGYEAPMSKSGLINVLRRRLYLDGYYARDVHRRAGDEERAREVVRRFWP